MASEESNSQFYQDVNLASIVATYEYATQCGLDDLREGAADTFCRLYEVFDTEELHALGVTKSNG
tara:strand:+ start:223 stop:417 length:195 start_codon:yes stop_codon:yes gene_type:complete